MLGVPLVAHFFCAGSVVGFVCAGDEIAVIHAFFRVGCLRCLVLFLALK